MIFLGFGSGINTQVAYLRKQGESKTMKTIKDAVIAKSGKWDSSKECIQWCGDEWMFHDVNELWQRTDKYPYFYHGAFAAEAKRLGYVGKYRWGVEYPTNGKRPELADDVFVQPSINGINWLQCSHKVSDIDWTVADAFKVSDVRFKPADTSYLNQCEYKGVADIDQMKIDRMCVSGNEAEAQSLTHKQVDERTVSHSSIDGIHAGDRISIMVLKRKPSDEPKNLFDGEMPFDGTLTVEPALQDDSWHERGELPPVGVDCEIRHVGNWIKCKPIGFDGDGLVCKLCIPEGGSVRIVFMPCYGAKFRPIRTEREKVIEAAIKVNAHTSKQDPRDMMVAVIHKLYDAGMLVLPQKKSDTED